MKSLDKTFLGAKNLLTNCAEVKHSENVLIIHEPESTGYYEDIMVSVVAECARHLGAHVTLHEEAFAPELKTLPDNIAHLIEQSDKIIFLSRVGDQLRFRELPDHKLIVTSYALDNSMLGSSYGIAHPKAFSKLCTAIDKMMREADQIKVTCVNGSDFEGQSHLKISPCYDISIRRFPTSVFSPIPAHTFSGRLALPGFLVGTGSMYYEPYAVEFSANTFAIMEQGRITGFEGPAESVKIAEDHYKMVAQKFDADPWAIHSWHAGIHPGCAFNDPASASYERWSGGAFGNPRLLHFHSCGDYAPGEISIYLIDPTIEIDGVKVWDKGTLLPHLIPGGSDILDEYQCAQNVFGYPSSAIGL